MLHHVARTNVTRRECLKVAGLGWLGGGASGWFPALANALAANPQRRRHCVLLWMAGGPSQLDTFDMKPRHANGGPFKEVATRVPGLRFSEHLPLLAEQAHRLAIVRSLQTKEGDHSRGTHLVRTGHPPGADVQYPSIACSLTKQLFNDRLNLPNYVSVASSLQFNPASFGPGFLGPQYAAATVGADSGAMPQRRFTELRLDNLELPPGIDSGRADRRLELWRATQQQFFSSRMGRSFSAHDTLYRRALDMMRSDVRKAFDLNQEPAEVREAYGPGRFGQGCLLARRLIERGVPFVEVALGDGIGWDTHQDNFRQVQELSAELDAGWSTLMRELEDRGLLEMTTIVWMGEFGRTPIINNNGGRDHYPAAWTCVFGGGGVQGGQAYGRTSAGGTTIEEHQVGIGDVLATLCAAVGVDPNTENIAESRPLRLAEGKPIQAVLA